MLYIILFLISIAGGYVAFRYISLLRAKSSMSYSRISPKIR